MMTDYLDLERRFGLLTKYSVEELLALNIMGRKHLGWEQLLTGRFSRCGVCGGVFLGQSG